MKGDRWQVRSVELSEAAFALRGMVDQLRTRTGSPYCDPRVGCVKSLVRDIARCAREVEAWGCELKDPCALTAAQEAHAVLKRMNHIPTSTVGAPFWRKEGSVLLVRVDHVQDIDPNALVGRLKMTTLNLVLADPPCSGLRVAVGLLPMTDAAPLECGGISWSLEPSSAMAPLLVTGFFRTGSLNDACDWVDRLESATHEDRYRGYVPWPSVVRTALVPLMKSELHLAERRCIGSLATGRIR